MSPDEKLLIDIATYARRIVMLLSATDEARFLDDPSAQDAALYRPLVIGEATKGLSAELGANHPAIAWAEIAGLREHRGAQLPSHIALAHLGDACGGYPRITRLCTPFTSRRPRLGGAQSAQRKPSGERNPEPESQPRRTPKREVERPPYDSLRNRP